MNFATTKGRILHYIDTKDISRTKFYEKTGIKRGFLDGDKLESSVSDDNIAKIIEEFPELSIKWLVTGKGDMIVSDDNNLIKPIDGDENKIKTYLANTRPHIPIAIKAGNLNASSVSLTDYQCERKQWVRDLGNYDYTVPVEGDSMMPRYWPGDVIACKFIDGTGFIQNGRVHGMDTSQGFVLKRIYDEGDSIRCESINSHYPSFSIPKKEVYRIALVVGFVGY